MGAYVEHATKRHPFEINARVHKENVDFQERVQETSTIEWTDRIIPDGTWSGNVFEFYRKVIRKLHSDLPIPFKLKDGVQRIEDTHLHQALREALLNTLIHADYEGRKGILVLKSGKGVEFRNPGLPRIAIEEIRKGGRSDCRNRTLQTMFMMIGLGEEAGSGFSRILRAWREQEWRSLLAENLELESTTLTLSTEQLIPTVAIDALTERFRSAFQELPTEGKTVLATAFSEGSVDHAGLMQLLDMHSRDLTLLLQKLVRNRMLVQDRPGRGCAYEIPPLQSSATKDLSLVTKDPSLVTKSLSLVTKLANQDDAMGISETGDGRDVVLAVSSTLRVSTDQMKRAIAAACTDRPLTAKELGDLLNRNPKGLLRKYIHPMVETGELTLLYPDKPRHPGQAYQAAARREDSGNSKSSEDRDDT